MALLTILALIEGLRKERPGAQQKHSSAHRQACLPVAWPSAAPEVGLLLWGGVAPSGLGPAFGA